MNNYKIFILGPSTAGKTIFIASLYNMLSTFQDKYGFFLSVEDDEDKRSLNRIYTELFTAEPGQGLSQGTVKTKEWKFKVWLQNRNLDPVCQFTCTDYRGGIVTDDNPDDKNFISEEIKKSDAVWVIIDGQKIIRSSNTSEDNEYIKFLRTEITLMMLYINEARRETQVNFLISKWDIIEQTNTSLSQIREVLQEQVNEFSNVVANRKRSGCSLYLIPVSSIGKDFFIRQQDGTIKKNPLKNLKPLCVEVPLIFFLLDRLNNQFDELKTQINSPIYNILNTGFGIALVLGGIILNSNLIFGIIVLIISVLLYLTIKSDIQEKRDKIRNKYSSIKNMLENCKEQKDDFVNTFPYANLSKKKN